MITQLQTVGHAAMAKVANALQLQPMVLPSKNGIQFYNHLNRTVFTVYDDRLDDDNQSCLEIALSAENIALELEIDVIVVEKWFIKLAMVLPAAKAKPPEYWPRVALQKEEHFKIFCGEIENIYEISAPLISTKDIAMRDEKMCQTRLTRRGQTEFRLLLLEVYSRKCAISGCCDVAALEAAHVIPHAENADYSVSNGILLRADLHRLFDLHLISIDPRSGTVAVSSLLSSTYFDFEGRRAALPDDPALLPAPTALMKHFRAWLAAENSIATPSR